MAAGQGGRGGENQSQGAEYTLGSSDLSLFCCITMSLVEFGLALKSLDQFVKQFVAKFIL